MPTFRLNAPVVIRVRDNWSIQLKQRQVILHAQVGNRYLPLQKSFTQPDLVKAWDLGTTLASSPGHSYLLHEWLGDEASTRQGTAYGNIKRFAAETFEAAQCFT